MSFRVESGQLADGEIHEMFFARCDNCGEDVWINTVTKDPREYDYYCVPCGTFIEQCVIDEIVGYMMKKGLLK